MGEGVCVEGVCLCGDVYGYKCVWVWVCEGADVCRCGWVRLCVTGVCVSEVCSVQR